MPDYSQLSDAQLMSALQTNGSAPTATDPSKMSDTELMAAISGQKSDEQLLSPVTTDSGFQPSPLTPMQRAMVAFPRQTENKVKELQNLGFQSQDIGVDENNQLTIKGKPIDPAVNGLWDLLKDAFGKAAQATPDSLSLIGQIGADLTATASGAGILGLVGANAAGAVAGEGLRQAVANKLTGEAPSGQELALQGGIGAITPPVAMGIGKAVQITKQKVLSGMAHLASSGRADKFVQVAGQVLRNTDPDQIQFAIDTVRQKGADAILNPKVADEDYAINFVKNNFFGDDVANTIKSVNPQVAKNLYAGVLGMPVKDVETLIDQGSAVYRMNKPEAMANLVETISKGISDPKNGTGLLNIAGNELAQARIDLIKQAGGVDAKGITETNAPVFKKLLDLGMLKPEANGGYSIVKDWAGGLSTGKQQQRIFTDYLERFAKQEVMSPQNVLERAAKGDKQAIAALADMRQQGIRPSSSNIKTYFPDNQMKYGEFARKLGAFDTQISGHEFDAVGKLAPELQQAVKGLRGVTDNVAAQVGNDLVPTLNKRFSQLAEDLGPLKQLVQSGDKSAIQGYLDRIIEEKDSSVQAANWSKLNALLKPQGINLLKDLNAYSAANTARVINTDEGKMKLLTSAQRLFDQAWEKNPVNDYIRLKIDPLLPPNKRILDNGKIHIVAKSLDKDARNLLKARFLSNGILGGMVGMHFGPLGAAAGMAAGFKAQDPQILKNLIQFAAEKGQGIAGKAKAVNIPRPLVGAGLRKVSGEN